MALHKIIDSPEHQIYQAINEFNNMLTSDYFTRSEAEKLFFSEGMDKLEADFVFTWDEYNSCYLLQQIQPIV